MSEQTPSQAEGERDDGPPVRRGQDENGRDAHPDVPRTTPSQSEGEREDEEG